MKAGFIGLGDLGAAIAHRLLDKGQHLVVWNRDAAKMAPLAGRGAFAARSPRDLSEQVDIVLLCISSPTGLEAVLFGPDGCANGANPNLVVDHSTVHPHEAMAWSRRLTTAGKRFIDAPLSGGAAGAMAGTLALMAGGRPRDVKFARPIFELYASRISHLGEVGSGQVAKACNQIINFGTVASIGEALALGRACGIDADRLARAFSGGLADSNMLREYIRGADTGKQAHMTGLIDAFADLSRGRITRPPPSTMSLLAKDLGIIAHAARQKGISAASIGLIENMFRILVNHGAIGAVHDS